MSHKPHKLLYNNYLHWRQKQNPNTVTLSRCYSTPKTPPNTILKTTFSTSNPKQPVTFHKTTCHFSQNNPSLFKNDPSFLGWNRFSTPSTVTLVTAKKQNSSMGAPIRARVKTPSASTKSSPHPILQINSTQSSKFTPPLFQIQSPKTFPTKKYSSAMKQPTTNHSSNPKPRLICTTYTSISQNKDDKTKYRHRKNGTNMPFFHSLGVFLPIY